MILRGYPKKQSVGAILLCFRDSSGFEIRDRGEFHVHHFCSQSPSFWMSSVYASPHRCPLWLRSYLVIGSTSYSNSTVAVSV
jgi:hypothetical protein